MHFEKYNVGELKKCCDHIEIKENIKLRVNEINKINYQPN